MNARLFAFIPTAPELQDRLIVRTVAPVFAAFESEALLHSLSFARCADPDPLIRILVSGESTWIRERARLILRKRGRIDGAHVIAQSQLAGFDGELRLWGGEEGLTIAERIFHHDSIACIERLDLEEREACSRSRHEWSLLWTEGFINLLRFGPDERLDFYRRSHAWPIERGIWGGADLQRLEARYQRERADLAELLRDRQAGYRERVWGDEASAAIAERSLARLAPVVVNWTLAHTAGRLAADWGALVSSVAHVHALRLGIDPIDEAMLRFLLFRLHEDGCL